MEEITLKETYNAIKRNILYILGATALAGILVLVIGIFRSGGYELKNTLMFGDPEFMRQTDIVEYRGELAINQQLVEDMKGILKNDALYVEVADDLGVSVGEVESDIDVKQVESSSLFEVTFSGSSKDKVLELKSAYLQNLKQLLNSTYSTVKLYNLSENSNFEPVKTGLDLKLMIAAAFVAFMVSVCWAMIREYQNPRLYDGEQIERRLNVPFLGMCSLKDEDTAKQDIILKSWEKKFNGPLIFLPQDVSLDGFLEETKNVTNLQVKILDPVEKDRASILEAADGRVILFIKKDKTGLLDVSATIADLKNLDADVLGVFIDE